MTDFYLVWEEEARRLMDLNKKLRADLRGLKARIKLANGTTCRALRNICEDNHPELAFDPSCAWCEIKLALNLKAKEWRVDYLTVDEVERYENEGTP